MKCTIYSLLRQLRTIGPLETDAEAASRIGVSVETYRTWLSSRRSVTVDVEVSRLFRPIGHDPSLMAVVQPLCCRLAEAYSCLSLWDPDRDGCRPCDPIRISIGLLPHAWASPDWYSLRLDQSCQLATLLATYRQHRQVLPAGLSGLRSSLEEWMDSLAGPVDAVPDDVLDLLEKPEYPHHREAAPWDPDGDPHGA